MTGSSSDPAEAAVDWHRLTPAEAVARLASDAESGLSTAAAARRLAEAGPNALEEGRAR